MQESLQNVSIQAVCLRAIGSMYLSPRFYRPKRRAEYLGKVRINVKIVSDQYFLSYVRKLLMRRKK